MTMDSSLSVGFDGVLMIFVEAVFSFCKTKEEVEWNGNEIGYGFLATTADRCLSTLTILKSSSALYKYLAHFNFQLSLFYTRKSRWSSLFI